MEMKLNYEMQQKGKKIAQLAHHVVTGEREESDLPKTDLKLSNWLIASVGVHWEWSHLLFDCRESCYVRVSGGLQVSGLTKLS